jgi:hypothetical protein
MAHVAFIIAALLLVNGIVIEATNATQGTTLDPISSTPSGVSETTPRICQPYDLPLNARADGSTQCSSNADGAADCDACFTLFLFSFLFVWASAPIYVTSQDSATHRRSTIRARVCALKEKERRREEKDKRENKRRPYFFPTLPYTICPPFLPTGYECTITCATGFEMPTVPNDVVVATCNATSGNWELSVESFSCEGTNAIALAPLPPPPPGFSTICHSLRECHRRPCFLSNIMSTQLSTVARCLYPKAAWLPTSSAPPPLAPPALSTVSRATPLLAKPFSPA